MRGLGITPRDNGRTYGSNGMLRSLLNMKRVWQGREPGHRRRLAPAARDLGAGERAPLDDVHGRARPAHRPRHRRPAGPGLLALQPLRRHPGVGARRAGLDRQPGRHLQRRQRPHLPATATSTSTAWACCRADEMPSFFFIDDIPGYRRGACGQYASTPKPLQNKISGTRVEVTDRRHRGRQRPPHPLVRRAAGGRPPGLLPRGAGGGHPGRREPPTARWPARWRSGSTGPACSGSSGCAPPPATGWWSAPRSRATAAIPARTSSTCASTPPVAPPPGARSRSRWTLHNPGQREATGVQVAVETQVEGKTDQPLTRTDGRAGRRGPHSRPPSQVDLRGHACGSRADGQGHQPERLSLPPPAPAAGAGRRGGCPGRVRERRRLAGEPRRQRHLGRRGLGAGHARAHRDHRGQRRPARGGPRRHRRLGHGRGGPGRGPGTSSCAAVAPPSSRRCFEGGGLARSPGALLGQLRRHEGGAPAAPAWCPAATRACSCWPGRWPAPTGSRSIVWRTRSDTAGPCDRCRCRPRCGATPSACASWPRTPTRPTGASRRPSTISRSPPTCRPAIRPPPPAPKSGGLRPGGLPSMRGLSGAGLAARLRAATYSRRRLAASHTQRSPQ